MLRDGIIPFIFFGLNIPWYIFLLIKGTHKFRSLIVWFVFEFILFLLNFCLSILLLLNYFLLILEKVQILTTFYYILKLFSYFTNFLLLNRFWLLKFIYLFQILLLMLNLLWLLCWFLIFFLFFSILKNFVSEIATA